MDTFEALGVSTDLAAALAAEGIKEPTPIQAMTIADAYEGRDVCGRAETGSGKTLAFGLPVIERTARAEKSRPRALVLAPTRELAHQIRDVLAPLAQLRDLRVAAVYGGAPMDRQVKALHRGVDIMIATPGRLIDLVDRGELSLADVTILVLDEADRMVDMGFLPQVQWVLRRLPDERQTLLFSATLDRDVDHLVRTYTRDPVRHEVESAQPTVEAMDHRFLRVHEMDKLKVAVAVSKGVSRALLFVRTKRGADRVVAQLHREGVRAGVLHGGLAQGARQRAIDEFRSGRSRLLVATDVCARGLDIEGIDIVLHYDPPEDHKAYLHRSGRTARAGEAGMAVSLLLWNQVVEAERLRKRLGIDAPFVEVFSNDLRLADLTSADWEPAEAATGTDGQEVGFVRTGPAGRAGRGGPRRGRRRR